MKDVQQLIAAGYRLLSYSSNGAFKVTSYLAWHHHRRVYGFFDHVKNQYIEQAAPK